MSFTPSILTGKDDEEDDGNVNEEKLEISKVTEDLRAKPTPHISKQDEFSLLSSLLIVDIPNRGE